MKYFLFLMICLSTAIVQSQTEPQAPPKTPPPAPIPPPPPPIAPTSGSSKDINGDDIVDFPSKEARFPGGGKALQEFINETVNYPETALDMGEQGKVYLTFVVTKNGDVTSVAIAKGASTTLNNEAIRVVSLMPKWKPAKSRGKKVSSRVMMPINFKLV